MNPTMVLIVCLAVLAGCKTGNQKVDPGTLSLDDVSEVRIGTNKSRAVADKQASASCRRHNRRAVFSGAKPNAANTATVYSYACR